MSPIAPPSEANNRYRGNSSRGINNGMADIFNYDEKRSRVLEEERKK